MYNIKDHFLEATRSCNKMMKGHSILPLKILFHPKLTKKISFESTSYLLGDGLVNDRAWKWTTCSINSHLLGIQPQWMFENFTSPRVMVGT